MDKILVELVWHSNGGVMMHDVRRKELVAHHRDGQLLRRRWHILMEPIFLLRQPTAVLPLLQLEDLDLAFSYEVCTSV